MLSIVVLLVPLLNRDQTGAIVCTLLCLLLQVLTPKEYLSCSFVFVSVLFISQTDYHVSASAFVLCCIVPTYMYLTMYLFLHLMYL